MSEIQSFAHATHSVSLARHFAREAVIGAPAEVIQTAELIVSELATNCIMHTDSPFDLQVTRTAGEIRIEMTDRGGGDPVLRSPGSADARGRGLQIVAMLSTEWGVKHLPEGGKTLWASVAVSPDWRPAHPRSFDGVSRNAWAQAGLLLSRWTSVWRGGVRKW